jgi:hypothetical protein
MQATICLQIQSSFSVTPCLRGKNSSAQRGPTPAILAASKLPILPLVDPLKNKNGKMKEFFYPLQDKNLWPPTFADKKIFAQKCSPPIPYIEGHTFFDRAI